MNLRKCLFSFDNEDFSFIQQLLINGKTLQINTFEGFCIITGLFSIEDYIKIESLITVNSNFKICLYDTEQFNIDVYQSTKKKFESRLIIN